MRTEETGIQEKERHETCILDKKRELEKREERRELHTHTTPLQIRMAVLEQSMHPHAYLRELPACFPDAAYKLRQGNT